MTVVPRSADPVPMTQEQKFLFDLKGWIMLPAVLEEDLLEACREHVVKLRTDAESLPENERYSLAGPGAELVDHPAITGVLREILAPDNSADSWGFRCESSFPMVRSFGDKGSAPHCGPLDGPMAYRNMPNGTIWSGLTRVVWELSPVQRGGGTPILSGSHKAAFPVPERFREFDPFVYEEYECPPGSVLIFSESCWHVGTEWQDAEQDRLAIFNCYCSYLTQWHKLNLPHEVVAAMPAKRQTAFRGAWGHNFRDQQPNNYYDETNRAH
jgi:hypothetical protein